MDPEVGALKFPMTGVTLLKGNAHESIYGYKIGMVLEDVRVRLSEEGYHSTDNGGYDSDWSEDPCECWTKDGLTMVLYYGQDHAITMLRLRGDDDWTGWGRGEFDKPLSPFEIPPGPIPGLTTVSEKNDYSEGNRISEEAGGSAGDGLSTGVQAENARYERIPEYEQADVTRSDGSALGVYYWSEMSSDYESAVLHLTIGGEVYQVNLSGVYDPTLVAFYWVDMESGYDYFIGVLNGEDNAYSTSLIARDGSGITVAGEFYGMPDLNSFTDDGVICVAARIWYGDASVGHIINYARIRVSGTSCETLSQSVAHMVTQGSWDSPEEYTYAGGYSYTIDYPLPLYDGVDRTHYIGSIPAGTSVSLEEWSLGQNYGYGGQEFVYYVTGDGLSGWADVKGLRESADHFLLAA